MRFGSFAGSEPVTQHAEINRVTRLGDADLQ
ncbi:hypothetical protein ABIB45_004574 [Arthrobacter sp. UYCo732]